MQRAVGQGGKTSGGAHQLQAHQLQAHQLQASPQLPGLLPAAAGLHALGANQPAHHHGQCAHVRPSSRKRSQQVE